jgi:hypothetical protein
MRFIQEIDGNNKISENLKGQSVLQNLLMEQGLLLNQRKSWLAKAPLAPLNPSALEIETEEIKKFLELDGIPKDFRPKRTSSPIDLNCGIIPSPDSDSSLEIIENVFPIDSISYKKVTD